jgi:hypothetical protein
MKDLDKIAKIQEQRDRYFMAVDRISPARWEVLTDEQRQQVRDYRQALLDITGQPGYPDTIIWPKKPMWL